MFVNIRYLIAGYGMTIISARKKDGDRTNIGYIKHAGKKEWELEIDDEAGFRFRGTYPTKEGVALAAELQVQAMQLNHLIIHSDPPGSAVDAIRAITGRVASPPGMEPDALLR